MAIVGTPQEAAAQIVQRYRGLVERISPTAYILDPALAGELIGALRKALEK